mgnify:CR=1 FL=1
MSVTIDAGEDSLAEIAAKINDADAGVSATVLKDASGERLLVRSTETGETNGFRITADDDDGQDTEGPTYGVGLVSRLPVAHWRVRRFEAAPDPYQSFWFWNRTRREINFVS